MAFMVLVKFPSTCAAMAVAFTGRRSSRCAGTDFRPYHFTDVWVKKGGREIGGVHGSRFNGVTIDLSCRHVA